MIQFDRPPHRQRPWRGWAYIWALLLTLVALILRLQLPASFGERPLLLLFLLPIIASALLGGLGPGLTATAIAAAITDYFPVPSGRSPTVGPAYDLVQWLLLIVSGVLVSLMSEFMFRARRRETAYWQQLLTTQESLRQSEASFQAIFEYAAMGLSLLTPDGRWRKVNRKFCEIVGYSPEELLALHSRDITHPDDLDTDFDYLRRIRAGEIDSFSREKRFIRKDGGIGWINISACVVRKADGSPDYFISAIEDIRQRKESESALVASESALKVAQRLAAVGSWYWDLRDDQQVWSEEVYRIYDRDPVWPPISYEEIPNYFTPESWQQLSAAVSAAQSQGIAYEYEAELVRSSGEHRWVVARGAPVCDQQGLIIGLHGTLQDITARKLADLTLREAQSAALAAQRQARVAALNVMEDAQAARDNAETAYAALHKSEALKQAILDSVGAHIAVLDSHGEIIAVNRPWRQFARDSEHADQLARNPGRYWIGVNYLDVCRRGDGPFSTNAPEALAGIAAVLDSRLPRFYFEYVGTMPDRPRWFSMTVTPLSGEEGGVVVSHIDISERKQVEAELSLWAQAFENAAFGLAIGDAKQGTFISVNPAFAAERGYRPDELVGKPIMTVYPDDLVDRVKRKIQEMDGTCHGVFETEHVCKDGSRFPVLMDVTVIKSADGQPATRVAYALNISDRKAAEEAFLRQTEELQRFNRAMVGREMDMIALKQQVNELSRQLGLEPPYPLAFLDGASSRPEGGKLS